MSNKIGIKLADGEFYPVLEDGRASRKRLVVTTVQDGQPSVQIDLYRGEGRTVADASYIGSLVVEGIPTMPKGEPDIRMDLGLAEDGTLTAFAQEAATGASQSLKVSLEALSEEEKYEIPDFEFSKEEAQEKADFSDEDFAGTDSLPSEADSAQLLNDVRTDAETEKGKPKGKTLTVALIVLGILVLLALLGFLAWKFAIPALAAKPEAAPFAAVQSAPAPQSAKIEPPAPAPEAAPAPVQAAESAPAEVAPAPEAPKKAVTFRKPGVTYKVKWGDTLWDLSYSFYRNPWIFVRIAKANKIKNPDLIICGAKLWIPAK
jgi:nucleoid-associated protein YgaU